MKRTALYTLVASAALLSSVTLPVTHAATITASELIKDTSTGDNSNRNLTRERNNGGSTTTENSDSTIGSQNNIDSDFGVFNDNDVTYSHQLGWLTHGTLTGASLAIESRKVDGSNDRVYVDLQNDFLLGALTSSGSSIVSSVFNIAVNYLSTGVLNIKIDKSNNDNIEIVSSKLSVTWETASSPLTSRVPDGGATLALLGFGLMGVAACSRKLASKKN